MEYQEYKTKMAQAITNDDITAIDSLNKDWNKSKQERQKAEVEALRKETEVLAGAREKLSAKINKAMRKVFSQVLFDEDTHTDGMDKELEAVKAIGYQFIYKADGHSFVEGIIIPVIKGHKADTGGGAGKTKEAFGMSLSEVYDKYHNDEDAIKLVEAVEKDRLAGEKLGKTTNSNQWRVKNEVKKRVLAEGLLAPQK